MGGGRIGSRPLCKSRGGQQPDASIARKSPLSTHRYPIYYGGLHGPGEALSFASGTASAWLGFGLTIQGTGNSPGYGRGCLARRTQR